MENIKHFFVTNIIFSVSVYSFSLYYIIFLFQICENNGFILKYVIFIASLIYEIFL